MPPIDMSKAPKNMVDLVKKAQFAISKFDLTDTVARVALVLDYSGSAAPLYASGAMQAAAEKILAVATQFDDDGAVDVFFFHNSATYAGELTLDNCDQGIARLAREAGMDWGGTNYASAIAAVTDHYFGATKPKGLFGRKNKATDASASALPVYCAFLTDGATADEAGALRAAVASSQFPIFFQSVGLGDPREFGFIRDRLNSHGGKVDNFGFFTSPDISTMKDMALLEGLLNEFPQALTAMRDAGTLR